MILALKSKLNQICSRYLAHYSDNFFEPILKGIPGDKFFALTTEEPNNLQVFKWGFESDKPKTKPAAEAPGKGIVKNPLFLHAIRSSRCVIPVTSFTLKAKSGQPITCTLRKEEIFSLAGVFYKDTFAIVTTDSNRLLDPYCDYMPLVLTRGEHQTWLKKGSVLSNITAIIGPFDSDEMNINGVNRYWDKTFDANKPVRPQKDDNNINKEPFWKRNK
jgi:putative SOS response-associated peptidase YedK